MDMKIFFALLIAVLSNPSFALSQVEDTFSDGDYTNNPAWSGDIDKFVIAPYVLDESNLVLRSNNTGAANYYLSTPSSLVSNTQWEFFVNLRFATSGSNYVDIYLVADNPNLSTVLNAYFIRIGRTQDDITFWRRQSGTDALLIEGPAGQVGSSTNNPFNIRVTHTDDGLWTLFADPGNTGNFQILGSVNDVAISTANAFGFRIVQSTAASVVNNHWFDKIKVGPIPIDETSPQLVSAQAISATEVEIYFDESVDQISAEAIENYSIDGSIGNPIQATRDNLNFQKVNIQLGGTLTNGQNYTLTIQGVQDLSGNAMGAQSLNIMYFTPSQASFRELVFNELLADPTPVAGMPDAEFIELFNTTTDKFFDISGWVLVNSTTARTLGTAIIPPGGFVLLSSSTTAGLLESFGPVLGISSFVALTNSADSITLINPQGDIIDFVSYTDNWYNDPVKKNGGYSLEQINPFATCSGAQNWNATNDALGGTPNAPSSIFDPSPDIISPLVTGFSISAPDAVVIGFSEIMDSQSLTSAQYSIDQGLTIVSAQPAAGLTGVVLTVNEDLQLGVPYTITITGPADCEGNFLLPNTQVLILIGQKPQFGDLIINEIMADPTPAIGLPPHEYFELYNRSDKVIDLLNCRLSDLTFAFPKLLQPGQYLLCVSSNVAEDFGGFPEVYIMQGMSTTFLTNGGREVILYNQDDEVINALTYNLAWYQDPGKDDGGWSLELINPFAPCSEAQNWMASNDPFGGTPGAQNSVFSTIADTFSPVLTGYEVSSPDEIRLFFNEIMDELSLVQATYTWNQELITNTINADDGLLSVSLGLSTAIQPGTIYQLTINGPLDCSGNALAANSIVNIQIGETPGEYDLLITEIMADPSPSVGLPEAEYFELFNASDKVIQLQGCQLSGVEFTPGRLSQPGEYVLCVSTANQQEFTNYPTAYIIDGLSTSFLTNGGRELLLLNPAGDFVDRVNYSSAWYRDNAKDEGGWSLERININEPCRAGDNWVASAAVTGGTPGAQNSQFSTESDIAPPFITAIYVQNPSTIEIRFNEVIDQTIVPFINVEIPGIGIQSISSIAPGYTSIIVILDNSLSTGVIYELYVSGLTDCTGNLMIPSGALPLALPQEGLQGDLIINEVLFNPRTDGVDFVEIVNLSEKVIGLQNWALQNQDGTTRIISTDPLVIMPGAYMVLTSNPVNIELEYPLGKPDTFILMNEGTPSFNISSGAVILANTSQSPIDRFDYLESFHLSLLRSFKGVSLERLSFTRPTNDSGNWTSAAEVVGYATPGYKNSQFAPEAQSTGSFSLQNEVFSPDNDGFDDVLLINYKLDISGAIATIQAYDRRGRLIRNIANNTVLGTEGTISWDGTSEDRSKARIGPHIIYIDIYNTTGRTQTYKLGCVVAGRLNN